MTLTTIERDWPGLAVFFAITRAISVRAIAPAKWLLAGHRDLLFEADDARPRSLFGRRCLRGGRSSESFQQCHDG